MSPLRGLVGYVIVILHTILITSLRDFNKLKGAIQNGTKNFNS